MPNFLLRDAMRKRGLCGHSVSVIKLISRPGRNTPNYTGFACKTGSWAWTVKKYHPECTKTHHIESQNQKFSGEGAQSPSPVRRGQWDTPPPVERGTYTSSPQPSAPRSSPLRRSTSAESSPLPHPFVQL